MFMPLCHYYYWRTKLESPPPQNEQQSTAAAGNKMDRGGEDDGAVGPSSAKISKCDQVLCQPLRSNSELFAFEAHSVPWRNLVKPLKERAAFRELSTNYGLLSFTKPSAIQEQIKQDKERRKVLVCHDLMGNYKSDAAVDRLAEDYSSYRFYHWAGVDIFCYFSHNYVTIPPLQWINAAHQNGVKVLGTFIVEFEEGQHVLDEVLSSDLNVNKAVDKLVLIAKTCQFEGWLINIECQVVPQKVSILQNFLQKLTQEVKRKIPEGMVVWYDSVTHSGSLVWQNKLCYQNCNFFEVSDGIFTNYNWTNTDLLLTDQIIRDKYPDRRKDVFFGVDIFGRGQVAKHDTHQTVARIKENDFSMALFAPAWTFETIPDRDRIPNLNEVFLQRNNRFFSSFWKDLYTSGPREMPFYSSFCLGSGSKRYQFGRLIDNRPWFDLRAQSIPMSVPIEGNFLNHDFSTAFEGGSCLKISRQSQSLPLRLFCCDFCCENDLIVGYAVKKSAETVDLEILLNVVNGDSHCQIVCGSAQFIRPEVRSWPGHYRVQNMQESQVAFVKSFLERTQEKHIPCHSSELNGWEIRYYYLSFGEQVKTSHCVDIGVRIRGRPIDNEWAQLGAISVHEGEVRRLKIQVPAIKESDFVASTTTTTTSAAGAAGAAKRSSE